MKGFPLRLKLVLAFTFVALLVAISTIYQAQITNQAQEFLLAALPILAALALGFLVSGGIDKSLGKIKNGAQRMANGDFSQKIAIHSHDELGDVASVFNQMSDRLRDSYRRLALEKQRDEALLEGISEGMIAVNEEGRIMMVNRIAIDLLELPSRDQVEGISLFDAYSLYTPDDKPLTKDKQPVTITLASGQPASDIFTFKRSDDKKILVNVSASPVILDKRTVGAIILLRDVTKEKEIDRMKTEFISLASHQLRTPLSAIKWYTEMLLSGDAGKLNDDQNDFAKSVYDSSERMIDLVNSLLNISRIESGRIIVDPKPTDLKELVSGIVVDLKAKTEERNQTLIISVHKDLPKINLDPRLIGQVYMNLLTNAIKYTPKGGEISVFISKKDNMILSQVTDNGYGIPKSQHDKVFQKFFRAENIVKVETDGTGLGLYLIKAIIESSGGKIWFDSSEGKGTTFWFTLPLSGMKAKEGEVTLDA